MTARRKNFFGTDTMILFTSCPLPFRKQYLRAPYPPQFPFEKRSDTAVLPESLSAFGNENRPGIRASIALGMKFYSCPFRQISMALAAEGTSAVGAETSMVRPASSIDFTIDLP